jgi:hypothetical protein
MYGAYCATKIFRLHPGKRVLVLDAGRFLVSEHVQNLGRIGPPEMRRMVIASRRWGGLLLGVAIAAAGCASVAGPAPAPPTAPAARPLACSPGWTLGADGTCLRDPSNFGGRGAGVGQQFGG